MYLYIYTLLYIHNYTRTHDTHTQIHRPEIIHHATPAEIGGNNSNQIDLFELGMEDAAPQNLLKLMHQLHVDVCDSNN